MSHLTSGCKAAPLPRARPAREALLAAAPSVYCTKTGDIVTTGALLLAVVADGDAVSGTVLENSPDGGARPSALMLIAG
jgi:hypothetical protein